MITRISVFVSVLAFSLLASVPVITFLSGCQSTNRTNAQKGPSTHTSAPTHTAVNLRSERERIRKLNIKSQMELETLFAFGKPEEAQRRPVFVTYFDTLGRKTEIVECRQYPPYAPFWACKYYYDAHGHMALSQMFYPAPPGGARDWDSELSNEPIHETCDSLGLLTERSVTAAEASETQMFRYDSIGDCTSEIVYDVTGTVTLKTTYQYSKNGYLIGAIGEMYAKRKLFFDELLGPRFATWQWQSRYAYDSQGSIVDRIDYGAGGEPVTDVRYKYTYYK